ncbi:MAG: Uma2 family endonuclease [Acidobacteria bacterium]|nr:Uma2 family endonuclease [Acidobacteriota bacterium]
MLEALVLYAARARNGRVFAESLFTLSPDTAREPDLAFIAAEKLRAHPVTGGVVPFAPDLAVEIISDTEPAREAERKVHQYLAAGVFEIWQVYPDDRLVRVRRADTTFDLRSDQVLETSVLPGCRAGVGEFFD